MKTILCTLTLLTAFACAHTPEWTPQQRRALQTRSFNASYRNVFLAIKDVLQDDGYLITSQDYNGGLVVAKKEVDNTTKIFKILTVVAGSSDEITNITFQISFNIERVSKKNIETRLVISRKDSKNRASEIVEPKIYQSIYRNLQLEIKRRQARGKS